MTSPFAVFEAAIWAKSMYHTLAR